MPQKLESRLVLGDCRDKIQPYVPNGIDCIYLDPPFNSGSDYNFLFNHDHQSHLTAFEDTWKWNEETIDRYRKMTDSGSEAGLLLRRCYDLTGPGSVHSRQGSMLAYLVYMAEVLQECKKVMSDTGNIIYHCDPTADAYIRLLMDGIFGPYNYQNDVPWKRTNTKSLNTRRLPTNHDTLYIYGKSPKSLLNKEALFIPYDLNSEEAKRNYPYINSDGRRFGYSDLTNPSKNRPNLTYEYDGVLRVWRYTRERMHELDAEGRIQHTPGKMPKKIKYLDEAKGMPLDNIWTDIPRLSANDAERSGYPTEKPIGLLKRLLRLCCIPGGTFLEPFCGCGTGVVAAEMLGHPWIGIDIAVTSITKVKEQLEKVFGKEIHSRYGVYGEPTSLQSLEFLIETSPHPAYRFQDWLLGAVAGFSGAKSKKGGDRGIDGIKTFMDCGQARILLISAKHGNPKLTDLRDLHGVMGREDVKASIGLLGLLREPSQSMRNEAKDYGMYQSVNGTAYDRVQIITALEYFEGKRLHLPPTGAVPTLL